MTSGRGSEDRSAPRSPYVFPFSSVDESRPRLRVREAYRSTVVCEDSTVLTDLAGGLWSTALGHRHPELVRVASEQLARLPYFPVWNGFAHGLEEELAERLLQSTFGGRGVAMFTSGGGMAVELAIKLGSLRHMLADGHTGWTIALREGYHGAHLDSLRVTGQFGDVQAAMFGLDRSKVAFVELNDLDGLDQLVANLNHDIANILVEPLVGNRATSLSPAFVDIIGKCQAAFGATIIADEVTCGLYRCGPQWFGMDLGLRPDIVVSSKALTNGMFAFAAVLISGSMVDQLSGHRIDHGESQTANPVACAVALETLRLLESPDVVEARERLFSTLDVALSELVLSHGVASRGTGGFRTLYGTAEPATAWATAAENGVLTHPSTDGLTICPSFLIDLDELMDAVEMMADALR